MLQKVLRNDPSVHLCWDEGEKREVAVLCNDWRHASGFGRLFKHPR
jgi:hypothetical protein